MTKEIRNRLRENHKPIYAILWLLEKTGGKEKAVPSTTLADLIERSAMTCEIHKKNYNRTCRTLVEHGMLIRTRDDSTGRLSFNLTDKSREIADKCFEDVFKMSLQQFLSKS
ncbi:hypothetical protein VIBNISOn1_1480004 [Vibrio nigripulchritudo SOn1]|uniref:MarR family transcriptional regulator n=1 Tax=Vibrio nigripulchritudo SOn1 TaxID=1238450 RepID=A0AAV2VM26_9VIBR|nr:hypothetical protein [Vibrio nigripulchritudo]CCO45430.1 hypothetical protein VIBNISOn1_1480004 [Vibrio nigripulchritudo SOn1]